MILSLSKSVDTCKNLSYKRCVTSKFKSDLNQQNSKFLPELSKFLRGIIKTQESCVQNNSATCIRKPWTLLEFTESPQSKIIHWIILLQNGLSFLEAN